MGRFECRSVFTTTCITSINFDSFFQQKMKKIALVLSIIVLFCGYHANAQITGSDLLFGGLALGALGGAFNGLGSGLGLGGGGFGGGGFGGGGFGGGGFGGGGFGGPVVGGGGYPPGTISKLNILFYLSHQIISRI